MCEMSLDNHHIDLPRVYRLATVVFMISRVRSTAVVAKMVLLVFC